jgi:hypothetical protein
MGSSRNQPPQYKVEMVELGLELMVTLVCLMSVLHEGLSCLLLQPEMAGSHSLVQTVHVKSFAMYFLNNV